ncbi:MAG: DUF255 domain-containing protein [Gammaproteobacteria bacterium]|nr:DUF255 domain-containing protein [Gammaproteobacteria bacterium]
MTLKNPFTPLVLLTLAAVLPAGAAAPPDAPAASGGHRLADATSPYLQQHAGNPVEWYPWGEEAFEKARREDKFILLSVGYSTCYWCHVMKRESFADEETAALLNRHAVSIKVDREERPDVDAIYMTAVQLLAGHGGWPMTLLLTADLEPFFAATYLPRDRFQGLIRNARELWNDNRPAVEAQGARVAAAIQHAGRLPGEPLATLPDEALADQAVARLAERFDTFDGGFQQAPKFPMSSILELLLDRYEHEGDTRALDMATTTLGAMARGGIHDQVGGGFHRYAIDNQWLVPHFEKMLYDNAQLLHTYARAHVLTGNAHFERVAHDIVAYVERDMTGPGGLFYSAQDAEVDAVEGESYLWTPEELAELLPAADYDLVRRVWGLDGPPDFEGGHILHWPRGYAATAAALEITIGDLMARLEPIRTRLLASRQQRPQPHLDDKVITAWNGLMIWALAYAGEVLERPAYVAMAERAATALLATLRDDQGRLLHVARHGRARLDAYLDDYAAVILGLTELHRVSGEAAWLDEARMLADTMLATLKDPAGGFHYAPPTVDHLLARPKATHDGAMPGADSLATRALVALARETDDRRYAAAAAATLRAYGPLLGKAPDDMPYMLWGLADYRRAGLAEDTPAAPAIAALETTSDHLRISARRLPGDGHRLEATLHLAPGWHVNATPASLDFLTATRVRARAQGEVLALTVDYPRGEKMDTGLGTPIRIYGDGTRLSAVADPPLPAGTTVTVHAQACNDSGRCLAPAEVTTRLEGPPPAAP